MRPPSKRGFYPDGRCIYEQGTPFEPRQPDSSGLTVPPGIVFVGEGLTIDGVMAIAAGYRPFWIWNLWERPPSAKWDLEPLSASAMRDDYPHVFDLSTTSRIRGAELSEAEQRVFDATQDSRSTSG